MIVFGDELRRLRRRSGLSQDALATRAGLSAEAISLLERGRRSPRPTTVRLLADAMELVEPDREALFGTVSSQDVDAPVPLMPTFLTGIVGRAAELRALTELSDGPDGRLITLLGPGGVGKTRLAVAYASAAALRFPGGVYWLPIASLEHTGLLPTLAGVLGIRPFSLAGLPEIVDRLKSERALVILDNAEHQPRAIAQICSALLADTDHTKILVTSRHALNLPADRPFLVSPLAAAPLGATVTEALEAPASQLFLARASVDQADPRTDPNAITRICHRLDGLPLALELAAARTSVLTLSELADTLESELQILHVVGPDGADELAEAMVGLTHDLLDTRERQLFARLSIFNTHFARDAVQAICGPEWTAVELMDVLSSLISRSLLVRCDDGSPQARFRLLQLIRGYATERLVERGEVDAVRRRHAEYFCAALEEAAANLETPDHLAWLAFMDREVANFRRAMSWSVTEQPQMLLRMVGALTRWFYLRGCYSDGRYWASVALEVCRDGEPRLRAPVLSSAGLLALLQCDYAVARSMLTDAESAYVAVGDLANAGLVASRLGAVARHLGDYELADVLHRKGMAYALSVGDGLGIGTQLNSGCLLSWIRGNTEDAEAIGQQALRHTRRFADAEGVAWAKMNLGAIARCRGDLQAAEQLLTEALNHADALGAREATAWTLNQLGIVARLQDDPERALTLQQASLAELEELGDRSRSASVHDELAAVLLLLGRPQESALHLDESDQLRAEIGTPVPTAEAADRAATVLATRDALRHAVLTAS